MALGGFIEDEDQEGKHSHLLDARASQRLGDASVDSARPSAPCVLKRDQDTWMLHLPNAFGSQEFHDVNHSATFTSKHTSSSLPSCLLCSFLILWTLILLQHRIMRTLKTFSSESWDGFRRSVTRQQFSEWCACCPLPFGQGHARALAFYAFSTGGRWRLGTYVLFDCCLCLWSWLFWAWDECH